MCVGGAALAYKNGWLTVGKDWLTMPEMIQSRLEVRLASVTVETGRSAEALVVATGYIESRRQARIGARAPGRIELVNVEEGSLVETGQVLAVLEHADLEASLAAVNASLLRAKAALDEQEITIAQSQRDFERAERQWKSKTISESEYDEKRFKHDGNVARRASLAAEITLAQARVREAEQMKENMFIKAPFNGTVISKDAEVGESILPGGMGEASGRGSAVTVADLEHLEVECDVKEDYISRVTPGQTAEVAVDAVPKFRYQGRVRKIIPMGDRARATIKVKVEIINVDARLFPNMSSTVYFLPAESESAVESSERRVFCDTEAIRADDASRFVWIADDQDRIRRQDVKTGSERDKRTEITEGLSGGERVVIAPTGLESGQWVKFPK
jgi:RND family efflux transporter MFP subunit